MSSQSNGTSHTGGPPGIPPEYAAILANGPPYLPMVWILGGTPKVLPDVPATAIFLFLFILGAAAHMSIFQINKRRGHKFVFSLLLFGFCMARIVTCIMRIAAACKSHNTRLVIAAQVFTAAGVLLLFIVNLIFARRLIRAQHPNFGWHKSVSAFFIALYVLIIITLAMVVTVTVQSFYTMNSNTHRIDRDVQRACVTFLTVISFLPIPMVIVSSLIPSTAQLQKFGTGRYRTKVCVLMATSVLMCFGAAYRCGTTWKQPVFRWNPMPGYYSRGAFYVVNFTIEIIVIYLYAFLRVDLRFHTPDGAHKTRSYTVSGVEAEKPDEETRVEERPAPHGRLSRVYTEEEAYTFAGRQKKGDKDVEKALTESNPNPTETAA